MVKNPIKVFGRIKCGSNETFSRNYEVRRLKDHDEITFHTDVSGDYGFYKNTKHKFRFCSIFDEHNTQSDIFDQIAKPVVNSVLEGYNGTIFAYGQTGSGKTYSMTGSTEYETRGIIPRTIQHIFDTIKTSSNVIYNVYISYLEIYNEIGYDLLNPRQRAAFLEELPRVTLLEDAKGQTHVRNLGVISVASEREAMCLLFLGDTNRTIAETPMNMYSTRSHCIFTVYVSATIAEDGRVRRSKLHLVDLAGSERIQKSGITGNLLVDARQINLSLHYLEQVITALSDEKRIHIPYRNSMMTSMLKDSLGGNCLTVMLATISNNPRNFEETISTCKFAQRVALVSSDAHINEEQDPEIQITQLKLEIESLKKEIILLKDPNKVKTQMTEKKELTPEQTKECENQISGYINSPSDNFPFDENDDIKIKAYFKIFKNIVKSQMEVIKANTERQASDKSLSHIIKQKDNEISILAHLLSKEKIKSRESDRSTASKIPSVTKSHQEETNINHPPDERELEYSVPMPFVGDTRENKAFEMFMCEDCNKLELNKCAYKLKQKIAQAKTVAETIQMCKNNIVNLKAKLRENVNCGPVPNNFMIQLKTQQEIYRDNINHLRNLKIETDHLNYAFQQEKLRLVQRFKNWWSNQQLSMRRNTNMFSDDIQPQSKISDKFIQQYNSNCSLLDTFPSIYDNDTNFPFDTILSQLSVETATSRNSETYKPTNSNYASPNCMKYMSQNQISSTSKMNEIYDYGQNRKQYTKKCNPSNDFIPLTQIINQYSGQPNNIHYQYSIPPNEPNYCSTYRQHTENIHSDFVDYNLPEKLNNSSKLTEQYHRDNNSYYNYFSQEKTPAVEQTLRCEDLNSALNLSIPPKQEQEKQDKSADFLKTIPLTGDSEVDEEILAFYRAKHNIINNGK